MIFHLVARQYEVYLENRFPVAHDRFSNSFPGLKSRLQTYRPYGASFFTLTLTLTGRRAGCASLLSPDSYRDHRLPDRNSRDVACNVSTRVPHRLPLTSYHPSAEFA